MATAGGVTFDDDALLEGNPDEGRLESFERLSLNEVDSGPRGIFGVSVRMNSSKQ